MSRSGLGLFWSKRRGPLVVSGLCLALTAFLPGQIGRVGSLLSDPPALRRAAEAARAGALAQAEAELTHAVEVDPADARAYRDLVDVLYRRQDPAHADTVLRRLRERNPDGPNPHYALGKLLYLRGDLPQARAEAEEALRRDPRHGYALLLLGITDYSLGRSRQALRSWGLARREFVRRGDFGGEVLARNNLAMVRLDLHEYERALEEYERALRIQRSLGNAEGERLALSNLGLTLVDLGRYADAIPMLDGSLELARRLHDPIGESRVWEFLCDVRQKMGDYTAALEAADSLVRLAVRSENAVAMAAGLLNRATALNDLGEPVAALADVDRGLCLAESIGHTRYISALLLARGESNLVLGRLSEARRAYRGCDSVSRATGYEANSSIALAGLSQLCRQEGDTAQARVLGVEALSVCRRIGYTEGEGQNCGWLAELALARGDRAEARRLIERSIRLARRCGRQVDVARALARRAQIRSASGDASGALGDAREGERIARLVGSPDAEALCAMVAGDVLSARDPAAAMPAYETALACVEGVQRRLRLEEFKAGYLQNRRGLYYRATELLRTERRLPQALEMSERFRARAFRDFLASGPAERGVAAGGGAVPGPSGASAVAPSASAAEIVRTLRPHEVVWEYFLGSRESLCFIVRSQGVECVRLSITESQAAAWVDTLRRALASPRSLATLPDLGAVSARLRERLVDPLLAASSAAKVVYIVPDGALHVLPFEMLGWTAPVESVRPDAAARPDTASAGALYSSLQSTRYLGDDLAVCYLPAASLLGRRSGTPGSEEPSTSRGTLAVGGGEGGPARAGREVTRILRIVERGTALTGEQATESAFKEACPRYRNLHIAAHGQIDAAAPLYSWLQLEADREGQDDGRLHAYEVMSLPLQCDLVSLSACETGLGKLYAGEGILGIARAFLCAGAGRALVSLWRVNDEATAQFMERFYTHLQEDLPAVEAVQRAKSELRRGTMTTSDGRRLSLAHPFFWAPFVLIEGGNGGGSPPKR